jgi:hypothetical protein
MTAPSRAPILRAILIGTLVLATPLIATSVVREAFPRAPVVPATVDGLAPILTSEDVEGCVARGQDGFDEGLVVTGPSGGRVSAALVLSCPAAFDGAVVTYAGEVVGDVLVRDGGAWLLVNDDDYALEVGPLPTHRDLRGTNSGLAVWLPADQVTLLGEPGRPGRRGDIIQVVARVARTDLSDGGGLTLRASEMVVLAAGASVDEPLDVAQAVLAGILLAIGIALGLGRRVRDRR